jgi:signal peptidase II
MQKRNKGLLLTLTLVLTVVIDQITKLIAQANLIPAQRISYLGDLFRWHYSENTGALLGIGANLSPQMRVAILIVFNALILVGMFWFVWASDDFNALSVSGAGLMIGGGFSNILDRLFYDGAVVDFMNIGIGKLRTGIFNVADVAIMVGGGAILLGVWLGEKKLRQAAQETPPTT